MATKLMDCPLILYPDRELLLIFQLIRDRAFLYVIICFVSLYAKYINHAFNAITAYLG